MTRQGYETVGGIEGVSYNGMRRMLTVAKEITNPMFTAVTLKDHRGSGDSIYLTDRQVVTLVHLLLGIETGSEHEDEDQFD